MLNPLYFMVAEEGRNGDCRKWRNEKLYDLIQITWHCHYSEIKGAKMDWTSSFNGGDMNFMQNFERETSGKAVVERRYIIELEGRGSHSQ
jgi:hypothetical protein